MEYGMMEYGMMEYGMMEYGMMEYGMMEYGMMEYGMMEYGMMEYGMMEYGTHVKQADQISKMGKFPAYEMGWSKCLVQEYSGENRACVAPLKDCLDNSFAVFIIIFNYLQSTHGFHFFFDFIPLVLDTYA